jgi:hypothetical protein
MGEREKHPRSPNATLNASIRQFHENNCDECVFLGHYYDRDMWYCNKNHLAVLMFIGGDDGEIYPYSSHKKTIMGLLRHDRSSLAVKRLGMARLLADAAHLEEVDILINLEPE